MSFRQIWDSRFGRHGPRFESHLREMREAAGLSEQDLADFCEVSLETIQLVEQAKYEPTVVLAEHIARRLNTTVEAIFTAHSVSHPRGADLEERLNLQTRRAGYRTFFALFAISLIGANILYFENEDAAAIALSILWAVGTVLFLIATTTIPGYWRFLRKINRVRATRKIFWIQVIGNPVLFAILMELSVERHKSFKSRIISFLYYAISYGALMYWLRFRKPKRDPK